MKKNIEVRWKKGSAAHFTDVFPADEFSKEVVDGERTHLVVGPRGGNHSARFLLTVSDREARLDYVARREYNERHGMDLGVMRFRFVDRRRSVVESLWWNDRIVDGAEAVVAEVARGTESTLGELAVALHRRQARMLLRPGQSEFRRALDLTYGSKCCISGCTVPSALEAAHIEPFRNKQWDSPSNGLLLRRDLHALFDAGQVAIHPESRVVYVAPEAAVWAEYRDMHGKRTVADPQPGFEHNSPLGKVFRERWNNYKATRGELSEKRKTS